MKKEERFVYMDKVDFDFEVGEALGGNKVYPSIQDLIDNEKCCLSECGIVKVKIILEEVILPTEFNTNSVRRKQRQEIVDKLKELKDE